MALAERNDERKLRPPLRGRGRRKGEGVSDKR